MPLTPNTRLGPYEIRSPLGAGGMGEVYRARDTRLDRDVAIKVLPKHLSASVEFQSRFEREAKSISQLSHPHICTLHDVGHYDGTSYLVMELLDGETLSSRLEKGPLSLDEVLRYGAQIGSALDAAHRKSVIHRDLKPGNIVVTKSGAKLLDFGLAKSSGVMESDPSALTVSQPLTSKGTILGTFQYMAPEQLEGAEADARTDIFAFGAVLYEMLTGKRAFEGGSRASLIAAIMASQPRAISELQPMTPPALDRLIRKCLAKDPDARWQSAADIADELRWITDGGSQVGVSVPLRSARSHQRYFWIAGTSLLLLACAYLTFQLLRQGERSVRRVWSMIPAAEKSAFLATGDLAGPVVISPDGSTLAFTAVSEGVQRLWVRALSSKTPRVLTGTEGAMFPFWSADSRSLGYFAKQKLFTISAAGGSPMPVCEAAGGRGGTWNHEGVIVFAPAFRSELFRVPAIGGKPQPVTTVDEMKHTSHRWPSFCPDGTHFLYLAVAHGAAVSENNAVYLGSLDGSQPKLVMHGSANAMMASDNLLYPRENALLAARFDLGEAKLLSEPVAVATEVLYDVSVWRSAFSVSAQGSLVFHTGTARGEIQMVRCDKSGKELGKIGDPDNIGGLSLSPDGTKVATDISGAVTDVWVYDITRGLRTRLTFGRGQSSGGGGAGSTANAPGANLSPIWSPDGQSIVYANLFLSKPDATHRIIRQSAMGGEEEVLHTSNEETWVSDWSADGKYLLLCKGKYIGGNPGDIWVLPLEGDRTPFPLVQTAFLEADAMFSPDGKWVAFASDESGKQEVYVIPFHPDDRDSPKAAAPRGGKWQASTRGGFKPKWRGDGKMLYFASDDGYVASVDIQATPQGLEIGSPVNLFPVNQPAGIDPFDVSADGEVFVVNTITAQATAPIELIVNWDAELQRP